MRLRKQSNMWSRCWNRSKRILLRTPPRTLRPIWVLQHRPSHRGQRIQRSRYPTSREHIHRPHYLTITPHHPQHQRCRLVSAEPHLDLFVRLRVPTCPSSSQALCLLSKIYLKSKRPLVYHSVPRLCRWSGRITSRVRLAAYRIDRLLQFKVPGPRWRSDL